MNAEGIVREILLDRTHGATHLALRALTAYARSPEVGKVLLSLRPSMPMIAGTVRMAMRGGIPFARRKVKENLRGIVAQAREHLPSRARYLSFDSSGTIEAVLRALRGVRVEAPPADVALLGADALYENGDFVNLTGSGEFALRARKSGAAVIVVASSYKRVARPVPLEPGFELVPGHFVHAILTEAGMSYPGPGTYAGRDPAWLLRGNLEAGRDVRHRHVLRRPGRRS